MFATASASESSPYESGYDHGCDDAGIYDPVERYINQPGQGPEFHTSEFVQGYDDGFYYCGGGGAPEPYYPPYEERHYEGYDWWGICQSVDNLLSEPCETLVTPDGRALTGEGKRVLEKLLCIAGEGIGLIRRDLLPLVELLCMGRG